MLSSSGSDRKRLVAGLRATTAELSGDRAILVVSDGDGALVAAADGRGWHFPRAADGEHGARPADSDAVIAHLEELHGEGAEWLVFPATGFRWLDRYPDFHRYLIARYEAIPAPEHDCLLFRLSESGRTVDGASREILPVAGEPGLISVVIPCYNHKDFVGDAIESAIAQTYPNVEIIFVDDGSTDHPYEEVVHRYEGAVRSVWQPNQGLAAARNKGIAEARGAYLVFLDADDRLLPGALSAGIQTLYQHPDAAFAAGHYRVVDVDGRFKAQWAMNPIGDDALAAFLEKNCIGMHATVVYRRAVFGVVGDFDVSLAACEDYDLYLRIARLFPVARHEATVAEYRDHETNMSKDPERMLRTVLMVLRSQRDAASGVPAREAALRAGISRYRRQYGRVVAERAAEDLVQAATRAGVDRIFASARGLRAALQLALEGTSASLRDGFETTRYGLRELGVSLQRVGDGLSQDPPKEGLRKLRVLARHYPAGYRHTLRRLPRSFRQHRVPQPAPGDRRLRPASESAVPRIGHPDRVSVVIPCYNQVQFLREAIESVVAQTYPDVQIVFVNDGSSDRPYEHVVKHYPQVRSVWQKNQGLPAARNRGLHEATGEYVAFLDADDRLMPNALEAGVEALRRHADAAFATGHYRRIDEYGDVSYEPEAARVPSYHYKELLRRNYIAMHGTVMYRRGAIEAVGGFDERLTACEDWDLYLRITRLFSVCSHDEVVAEYRYHHGNMSRDPGRMLASVLEVLGAQADLVRGHDELEEALRAGISWHRDYYGLDGLGALVGQTSRAIDALRRYDPASHRKLAARRRNGGPPAARNATPAASQ